MTNESKVTLKCNECGKKRKVSANGNYNDCCPKCGGVDWDVVDILPEFDRINHGPFEHPVSDTCAECGGSAIHEFYGSDGNLQKAELIATNSVKSWTKRLCNQCWTDFQTRAFVTIDRQGNTFTATCAF